MQLQHVLMTTPFLENPFILQLYGPDYELFVWTVSLGFTNVNDFEPFAPLYTCNWKTLNQSDSGSKRATHHATQRQGLKIALSYFVFYSSEMEQLFSEDKLSDNPIYGNR